MRPKSEFPQTFDFEHVVTESEQAADLEELKQLVLSDTAISRHVAPRLRLLRLIEKRYSVKFRLCKGYTITHWIEKLECGHEHHVYQVEDLTAKRRNCPTCAKAAQLQNADELIQVVQDSGRGEPAEQEQNQAGRASSGVVSHTPPLSNERPEQDVSGGVDSDTRGLGQNWCDPVASQDSRQTMPGCASSPCNSDPLTPPKQPSQSVLRHKEKSA